jgi:zinc protease
MEVQPYFDDQLNQPLISEKPKPGSIVAENYLKELDVTELELQNGIRVVLKPTNFKNDEIVFTAFSEGGTSLVSDSNLVAAMTAINVIRDGGLGSFSREQLEKSLADKIVNVSPYIGALTEGLSGSASPQDLEIMFQLVYLYFTDPRVDSTTFESLRSRFKAFYENRKNSPESAFQDTVTVTLTQNHPRFRPWTMEDLKKMNLTKSFKIYQDRFADAGDFTFIFVGNFDKNLIKSLAITYLGALPNLSGDESWQDVTYDPPQNVIKKEFQKGLEPKSQTSLVFTGDFTWSVYDVFQANAFVDLLRIKLRERIRESLGGTYGVRVSGSFSRFPRQRYQIAINYGSDPQRVDELTAAIFKQIDSLKSRELPANVNMRVI